MEYKRAPNQVDRLDILVTAALCVGCMLLVCFQIPCAQSASCDSRDILMVWFLALFSPVMFWLIWRVIRDMLLTY